VSSSAEPGAPEPPAAGAGERGPPERPAPARRFGWVVGLAGVLAVGYITVNTLRTDAPGVKGLAAGARMPPFAVPLALSGLDGDANVATKAGQGDAGRVSACSVRDPRVLNICTLAATRPVVLAFAFDRAGKACSRQLDTLERVRRRHPQVAVAAVFVRGDRAALRSQIRGHGWGFPVGYDRDGAVANVYGVGGCPTLTFAYPGRKVQSSATGTLGAAALDRRMAALARGAAARGRQ
jgi:hypothetical protein